MVQRSGAKLDEHLVRPRLGIRRVLVAENLGPAVLVDPDCLHFRDPRHNAGVTTESSSGSRGELGIDVVGAAPAEPYDETERHIHERREHGLFADMRFTMARPEVSCHPETLLPGRADRHLRSALLLRRRRRARGRARAGSRATRGLTPTQTCGRSSTSSAGGSAGPTACSSTRTTMSTAREPPAPASASTGRTRC